jgi:ATP-dependent protease HslVU (ClpYQ) ATPase subunit
MRNIEGEIREFMRPSNILVHGRSGSGKTEIFRMIAKVYNAPFIKVEATKYTEVGYHGDDVTNIVVDLYKKSKLVNTWSNSIFNSQARSIVKGCLRIVPFKHIRKLHPSHHILSIYS